MRISKSLAAVVFVGSMLLAPTANAIGGDGKPPIDNATCKATVVAANAGKPVPDASILHRYDSMPSYMADGLVEYYVDANFPYRKQLDEAAADWNKSLKGKVVLREVSPKDADSDAIHIRYTPDPNSLTLAAASVPQKTMWVYIASADYPDAIRTLITHEFGHLLGIRHTCDYTVMAASLHRHPATHVTPTDVAAVLQDQFD